MILLAVVFANGNEYAVESAVRAVSPTRVSFQIVSTRLVLKRPFALELRIPALPVGGSREGHIDTVYMDDTLRVTRDGQGNLAIAVKDDSLEARGLG